MRYFLPVWIALTVLPSGISSADEPVPADTDPAGIMKNLDSADFAARQAAQEQLTQLSAPQIRELPGLIAKTPSAEAASRALRGLSHHFLSDQGEAVEAAWEALETLLVDDRTIVRDEATWVLSTYWKTRLLLTEAALTEHGALIVRSETAAAAAAARLQGGRNNLRGPRPPVPLFIGGQGMMKSTQVFLSDEWKGNRDALRLLYRLPGLQLDDAQAGGGRGRRFRAGNDSEPDPVVVFLVGGHQLSDADEQWLKGAFGSRVQERGEMMLGIQADGAVAGQGCPVNRVVPFGSADAAGLQSGDLILQVEDEKVLSFDDLVEELRKYAPGDTVELTVRRNPFARRQLVPQSDIPSPPTIKLSVRLLSWKDYARAIHRAATQKDAPEPAEVR